jgi:iron complex transport system substrate-binding protein
MVHAREMVDEAGRRVQVPEAPRRVVSLAPSITECLFALGLDEEIVGVTRFSNYPKAAASRPKVGSYIRVNLERILSLAPDLVLATRDGNPRDSVSRLARVGVPVYVVDPRDLVGLFGTLRALGNIFHKRQEAERIVGDLSTRLEVIRQAVLGRTRPRVLMQVGISPMVTVSRGTLQDRLIELAGGKNIASREPINYPTLSLERVLEARPEIILVSSMVGKTDAFRELDRWRRWRELPAVINDRLHVIDGDLIDRASPRILDGLEEMTALIQPEAIRGLKKKAE